MRSTSGPAREPAEQRGGAADREREASLRERDPAHVVEVDDGEREDDPVPERVHDAAGLDEPDRAREMRVEPAQVRRQRRPSALRYRPWSSRPGSRRCGWRRRSSSHAARRTRRRWCTSSSATTGVSGFGEAAPDRALRRVGRFGARVPRGGGRAARRRPVRARGDRGAAAGAARRAGGEGGARRGAARPLRQARRPSGLAAARPAARRAADLVDDLARRPRRHGAARGEGARPLRAAEAEARRRRRARRRARARRARGHRGAAAGGRERGLVARPGAGGAAAARRARRRSTASSRCRPATPTAPS